MLPSRARRNPILVQFSQLPQHVCRCFLFFCVNSGLYLAFCLVVLQPFDAGTNTYPGLYSPFLFCGVDTREDANIHKAIACKYLSNNICTVVGEWHHGYFRLGYLSSSTHFDLVSLMARKLWRQCVLVFAHDLGFRGGNCTGLPSNTGLFLSTGNIYIPLPPSTPIGPFRLFSIAPVSIFLCVASKFRNRSFGSILLFTIVFNF